MQRHSMMCQWELKLRYEPRLKPAAFLHFRGGQPRTPAVCFLLRRIRKRAIRDFERAQERNEFT
jgi:hypothetical protein